MGTKINLRQISGLTETLDEINNEIEQEEIRLDSILSGSTSDLDSFSEVISYINSIDSVNDSELSNILSGELSSAINNVLSTTLNNSLFINGDYLDGGGF